MAISWLRGNRCAEQHDAGRRSGFRFHLRSRVKPTRAVLAFACPRLPPDAKPAIIGQARAGQPLHALGAAAPGRARRSTSAASLRPRRRRPRPAPGPGRASATRRLASASESSWPSIRKKAYMPPCGLRDLHAGQRRRPATSGRGTARRRSTRPGTKSSARSPAPPGRRAARTPARTSVLNSISLPMRVERGPAAAPASPAASRSSGSSWRSCARRPAGRRARRCRGSSGAAPPGAE